VNVDAAGPDVIAPDVIAPDVIAPEVIAPDVMALEVIAPEVIAPDVMALEVIAPEVIAPDVMALEVFAPEVIAPEVAAAEEVAAELVPAPPAGVLLEPQAVSTRAAVATPAITVKLRTRSTCSPFSLSGPPSVEGALHRANLPRRANTARTLPPRCPPQTYPAPLRDRIVLECPDRP